MTLFLKGYKQTHDNFVPSVRQKKKRLTEAIYPHSLRRLRSGPQLRPREGGTEAEKERENFSHKREDKRAEQEEVGGGVASVPVSCHCSTLGKSVGIFTMEIMSYHYSNTPTNN